jgi:hypothetical protein
VQLIQPRQHSIQQLTLRYLDAIRFDPNRGNILGFLREKLKLNIELPKDLFVKYDVATAPSLSAPIPTEYLALANQSDPDGGAWRIARKRYG